MEAYLWLIFFICVFVSIIPAFKLNHITDIKRYQTISRLSMATFLWGLLILFQNILNEYYIVYYTSILIYPILFLIVILIYRVVIVFIKGGLKKSETIIFAIFASLNFIAAISNPFHLLYINLEFSSNVTLLMFKNAPIGHLFYIHLVSSYIVVFYAFMFLLVHLYKKGKQEKNLTLFITMMVSILLGVYINFHHLFISPFGLDPTFIFLSLITFVLYYIIYRNDFNLALISSSRLHILNHMRELYIIIDDTNEIIDCSNLVKKQFDLDLSQKVLFDDFIEQISNNTILYENQKDLIDPHQPDKTYFHLKKQEFKVSHFNRQGTLILLYDETLNVKLMEEIKIAKSVDKMTGAFNRNYYEEQREILDGCNFNCGVITFDINHLKLVNDTFGHKEGDDLLIRFVHVLMEASNKKDRMIFRMGGDEFLYVEKYTTLKKLESLIPQIEKRLKVYEINDLVGFSYGIELKFPKETFEETIIRADHKLYQYKDAYKFDKKLLESKFKEIKKRQLASDEV
jgi:diguanylate cyclase (GGDEF)-like protein